MPIFGVFIIDYLNETAPDMPLWDRRMRRAYPPLKNDSKIYSGEPQTKEVSSSK